jgi:hypothetical protein
MTVAINQSTAMALGHWGNCNSNGNGATAMEIRRWGKRTGATAMAMAIDRISIVLQQQRQRLLGRWRLRLQGSHARC